MLTLILLWFLVLASASSMLNILSSIAAEKLDDMETRPQASPLMTASLASSSDEYGFKTTALLSLTLVRWRRNLHDRCVNSQPGSMGQKLVK